VLVGCRGGVAGGVDVAALVADEDVGPDEDAEVVGELLAAEFLEYEGGAAGRRLEDAEEGGGDELTVLA